MSSLLKKIGFAKIDELRMRLVEADVRTRKARIQHALAGIQLDKVKSDLGMSADEVQPSGNNPPSTGNGSNTVSRYAIGGTIFAGILYLRSRRRPATAAQVDDLRKLIEKDRAESTEEGGDGNETGASLGSFVETLAVRLISHSIIAHAASVLGEGDQSGALDGLAESS